MAGCGGKSPLNSRAKPLTSPTTRRRTHMAQLPLANAIRALSMDAVEKAQSGHCGLPLGFADVATLLFQEFLKFDAASPEWPDRDRLILSAGHGSMLLYSLLYLTGYPDVTLDEIRNFRQLGSKTPGHPGVRPHARRRDHHGSAGPGPRQRRRHGDGGAPSQCALRRRSRQPQDLCDRGRWLPDGRHQPGSASRWPATCASRT